MTAPVSHSCFDIALAQNHLPAVAGRSLRSFGGIAPTTDSKFALVVAVAGGTGEGAFQKAAVITIDAHVALRVALATFVALVVLLRFLVLGRRNDFVRVNQVLVCGAWMSPEELVLVKAVYSGECGFDCSVISTSVTAD